MLGSGWTKGTSWAFCGVDVGIWVDRGDLMGLCSDVDAGIFLFPCGAEGFCFAGSEKFHEVKFGGRIFGIVASEA